MKDFNLQLLKGKIAEEIAKYHFEQMNFKVVRTGKEMLFKDLIELEGNKDFDKNLVFNIYNKILSKLPDFIIYKNEDSKKIMAFVEVKYRKHLNLEPFKRENGYEYALHIYSNAKNNEIVENLEILKYINNLKHLHTIANNTKYLVDFYVYLIANNNIYFGRVYENNDENKKGVGDYTLKLLTPEGVEKKYDNWPGFKKIAEDKIKKEIL